MRYILVIMLICLTINILLVKLKIMKRGPVYSIDQDEESIELFLLLLLLFHIK